MCPLNRNRRMSKPYNSPGYQTRQEEETTIHLSGRWPSPEKDIYGRLLGEELEGFLRRKKNELRGLRDRKLGQFMTKKGVIGASTQQRKPEAQSGMGGPGGKKKCVERGVDG